MKTATANLVEIGESRFGKGIFATRELKKNTRLFRITGKPLSLHETLSMGENECYCLQVGRDQYILPVPPFLYSNHSCAPNCALTTDLWFVTLTDIKAGQELTWDYSTSMLERRWTMECHCGSPECRHVILDFDQIPAELQMKYLGKNIVLPFICQYLSQKDISYYHDMAKMALSAG